MLQIVCYLSRCLVRLLLITYLLPPALIAQHRQTSPKSPQDFAKEVLKIDLRWGNPVFHAGMPKCVLRLSLEPGYLPKTKAIPPQNIYLLIDVSATMFRTTNIQAVKTAIFSLKNHLKPVDKLGVVTFSSEANVLTDLKPVQSGEWLIPLLDTLESGSSTNIQAGLSAVYSLIEHTQDSTAVTQIVLFTDGVTNARQSTLENINEKITSFKTKGVQLSIFGFGQDIDNEQLSLWTQAGNGSFYPTDESQLPEQLIHEAIRLAAPVATQFELSLEVPKSLNWQTFLGENARIELDKAIAQVPVILESKYYIWIASFDPPASSQPIKAKATVAYFDVFKKRTIRFEQDVTLKATTDTTQQFLKDQQVTHTYVLLTATAAVSKTAVLMLSKNWANANIACSQAINDIQTYYPNTSEPSLLQLYQTLQKQQEVILKFLAN